MERDLVVMAELIAGMQEELLEFRVSLCSNNGMRYLNDHTSDMRRTMLCDMAVYQLAC